MKISLFLPDKIVDFRLPNEISGSYNFDYTNDENKLINIEARDGKWVLYQTNDVSVYFNGNIGDKVVEINNYYILKKDNVDYLIYISKLSISNMNLFTYNNNLNLIIGNDEQANIKYNCPYLNNLLVKISFNNGLILQKNNNMPIYINKRALNKNQYNIQNGDNIEILGLRLQFIDSLLLINDLHDKIDFSKAPLVKYNFSNQDEILNVDIKDKNLYNQDDYFSKKTKT